MKKCHKCGILKPLSEFYKNASKPGGISNRCKPCQYEYVKIWRHKQGWKKKEKIRRRKNLALVERYKTFKGCAKCHYRKSPKSLIITRDSKALRLESTWTRKRLKKELEHNVVLCRNCYYEK